MRCQVVASAAGSAVRAAAPLALGLVAGLRRPGQRRARVLAGARGGLGERMPR